MINVTKTYLPPLDEYTRYLEKIWSSSWVTNNGPLLTNLESALKKELGCKHLFFTGNGTIAIQIAIKALGITKEIITTPFSYVATTSSILWENCKPVFADIDKNSFCIDPNLIEKKITPQTEAILATHVYGIPCDVEAIENIARKYHIKVIYDAAHAFGTVYKKKALAAYGDISTLSFHATKLFHTIEGGAIITDDDELAKKIRLYRSFGHIGDQYFSQGINGKNSEFHAAMGLCLLPRVPEFIKYRKELTEIYNRMLSDICIRPVIPPDTEYNYPYYPVLLDREETLLKLKAALEKNDIIPRRYFYPSLNLLPYLTEKHSCPVSENYASRILCLPLYFELNSNEIERIATIMKSVVYKPETIESIYK